MKLHEKLEKLNACEEAIKWANGKSLRAAWETCERADWMLWACGNANIDRKLLVLAACKCARTSLRYVPKGETRPRKAIETAEAWTRGEATLEQVKTDAAAAYAAADAAYAAAYAYAAYAYAAAYAAADAAYAAAAAAAYAADRTCALKRMAKLVRQVIPFSEVQKAMRRVK